MEHKNNRFSFNNLIILHGIAGASEPVLMIFRLFWQRINVRLLFLKEEQETWLLPNSNKHISNFHISRRDPTDVYSGIDIVSHQSMNVNLSQFAIILIVCWGIKVLKPSLVEQPMYHCC